MTKFTFKQKYGLSKRQLYQKLLKKERKKRWFWQQPSYEEKYYHEKLVDLDNKRIKKSFKITNEKQPFSKEFKFKALPWHKKLPTQLYDATSRLISNPSSAATLLYNLQYMYNNPNTYNPWTYYFIGRNIQDMYKTIMKPDNKIEMNRKLQRDNPKGTYGAPARVTGQYHKFTPFSERLNDPEYKAFQVNANNLNTLITPGLFVTLNNIAQGVNVNERVGNEITMHSLEFQVYYSIVSPMTLSTFRYIIVIDLQPNISPTTPSWSDILELQSVYSYTNYSSRDRYLILYDKTWTANQTNPNHVLNQYITLDKIKTTYSPNYTSGISKGLLQCFLIDQNDNPLTVPSIYLTWRLIYTNN